MGKGKPKTKKVGKKKKSGSNRGAKISASSGNAMTLTHKERRRMKRKEEREYYKLAKKSKLLGKTEEEKQEMEVGEDVEEGDKVNSVSLVKAKYAKDYQTQLLKHGSELRKQKATEKMRLTGLKNAIQKLELTLSYKPLHPEGLAGDENRSKLKGAARPAREIYPEYYPELYEQQREREKIDNLLTKPGHQYNLAKHSETFDYLKLHVLYAIRLFQYRHYRKALKLFKKVTEDFDLKAAIVSDVCISRILAIHLNNGDLSEAQQSIQDHQSSLPEKKARLQNPYLLWDAFLIAYISHFVVDEEEMENDDGEEPQRKVESSSDGEESDDSDDSSDSDAQESDAGSVSDVSEVETEERAKLSKAAVKGKCPENNLEDSCAAVEELLARAIKGTAAYSGKEVFRLLLLGLRSTFSTVDASESLGLEFPQPEEIDEDIYGSIQEALAEHGSSLEGSEDGDSLKIVERDIAYKTSFAVRYFHRSISWYKDADGIQQFMKQFAKKRQRAA